MVLVDEAYVDFGGESVVGLVDQYPNLLVTGTFSKSRSLAGLRLGYAVGSPELIEGLVRVKDSFNSYPVDALASAIGIASLAAVEWMAPNLTIWLLPVALPMLAAPVLIAWTSRPLTHSVFTVPQDTTPSPVVASYRAIADSWRLTWVDDAAPTEPHSTGETHAPA